MYDKIALGMFLRTAREKQNLTLEQLAEYCNLSSRCIGNIERGEADPKLSTIVEICVVNNIDITDLSNILFSDKTVYL